ncbi:MAG: type II secretion system protein [Lentisphaeria bacterium]|nr:type II secretion system protein [Lentisphaeria bacterium]
MSKNIIKSGFNLIEVTMAIAIVGIGIAGVMALFPPAIEANKTANNQNYIGMVASSFLGYLENQILSDFSNFQSGGSFASFTSNPQPAETLWTGTKTSLSSQGFPGLYSISGHNNVFAVESADGTVNALIAVWQSGNNAIDGFTASDADKVRRVYVEASWPAVLPYANREKKLYIYDVFKN